MSDVDRVVPFRGHSLNENSFSESSEERLIEIPNEESSDADLSRIETEIVSRSDARVRRTSRAAFLLSAAGIIVLIAGVVAAGQKGYAALKETQSFVASTQAQIAELKVSSDNHGDSIASTNLEMERLLNDPRFSKHEAAIAELAGRMNTIASQAGDTAKQLHDLGQAVSNLQSHMKEIDSRISRLSARASSRRPAMRKPAALSGGPVSPMPPLPAPVAISPSFELVSVEFFNLTPYAVIRTPQKKLVGLRNGDSWSGWTLVGVDEAGVRAEFKSGPGASIWLSLTE